MKRLQTKKSLIKWHPRFFFHRRVKCFEHKKREKGTKYILGKAFFAAIYKNSRPEVFCKKGVFRNFTEFTGKHLCQSLFFNKVSSSVFCCALGHFFIKSFLFTCILLDFKHIKKSTHANPTY